MALLALVAAILFANAALCFSMKRHQRLVFTDQLSIRLERTLRGAGYGVLAVSAWVFVLLDGALVGLAAFTGWFTVCMVGVAGTVTLLSQRD
ncbi:MAG: DUF3325 domain-containing protein [Pseudomonadota bacterium]